jgi:hypothetical protein
MIAVLGLAGRGVLRYYVPYGLETELAAARRQGIPTSSQEVRLPSIPPDQDAAPLYARAWALEGRLAFTRREGTLMENLRRLGISDSEATELRRAFIAHADYLTALQSAAKKPHLSLPPSAFRFASPPISQLAKCREAAKTFGWEASLLLREGHPLQAIRTQSLGYGASAQLLEQPMLLSLMTGTAIDAITNAGLTDILKKTRPDSSVAASVMEAAGRNLDEPDLHHAMLTEAADAGEILKHQDTNRPKSGSLVDRGMAKAKMAVSVHWKVKLIRASEGAPAVRRAALKRVSGQYAREKNHSPAYEYGDMIVPMGPELEDTCARAAAGRRVLYAGAAVLKYRAVHARFPATLQDAVNPVPQDPIGNCPLTYHRTTRGFEVRAAQTLARIPSTGLVFEYTLL